MSNKNNGNKVSLVISAKGWKGNINACFINSGNEVCRIKQAWRIKMMHLVASWET